MENLISKSFKKDDEISHSAVENYLAVSPNFINKFNHMIQEYTIPQAVIRETSHKYYEALNKAKKSTTS